MVVVVVVVLGAGGVGELNVPGVFYLYSLPFSFSPPTADTAVKFSRGDSGPSDLAF